VAEQSREEKALEKLNAAVKEFRENYTKFVEKNQQYLRVEDSDIQSAIEKAESAKDIKSSALIFEREIFATFQAREKKQHISDAKWTGKLGKFLKTLLPVAQVALQLTSAAAVVWTVIVPRI
jgi:hypothetical protein